MKKQLLLVSIFTLLASIVNIQNALANTKTKLATSYNNKNDNISISANNASFLELIKRIGLQTGIQFHVDLTINKTINYNVINAPLEKSIRQITKGLNTSITYTEKILKNDTILIISEIHILPDKETDADNTVPLSTLESSALAYAHFSAREPKTHIQADQLNNNEIKNANENYDHMQTRWLARVSRLPLDERMHIEKIIARHEKMQRENREHQKQIVSKARLETNQRQQNHFQQEVLLEKSHPERYQLRRQRLEEIRQQLKEDIQQ